MKIRTSRWGCVNNTTQIKLQTRPGEEGQGVKIMGSVQWVGESKWYTLNNGAAERRSPKLTELKEKQMNSHLNLEISIFFSQQLVGDIDRRSIRTWNVQATLLTNLICLTDCSTLPATVESVFLLRTYRAFTKRDHVLGHRTHCSTAERQKHTTHARCAQRHCPCPGGWKEKRPGAG